MGIAEDAEGEAYNIVSNFWKYLADQKWDLLKGLLDVDFEACWPQSREKMDAEGFVEVNKNYPGTHKIEVANMNHEYDCWDHGSTVITQTYIKSKMPDDKIMELYAISFFTIIHDEDGEKKITELIEYWADAYPPPDWRRQWVKISDKRIM